MVRKYLYQITQRGFTLIELLVVLGILATLIGVLVSALNPLAQFTKANDGKRQEEILSIRSALDAYYNDHGCYPTWLPFGGTWTDGTTTYLKQVPQDPDCVGEHNICYAYQTDGSDCPQWNILYAKLQSAASENASCQLANEPNCKPIDYNDLGYNYCVMSGSPSCTVINNSNINPSSRFLLTPTPTGVPPTPTPTLTPVPTDTCHPRPWKCVLGTCNNSGGDSGSFCGYAGCSGNSCCRNACH